LLGTWEPSSSFQEGGADEVVVVMMGLETSLELRTSLFGYGSKQQPKLWEDLNNMTRQYDVTLEEVSNAWKSVRKSSGACGFDKQTIADIEKDLENQIYKIWNRMSSGSYMAEPVLLVEIPKAKGGVRQLGIPTVCDRIAQKVVKNRVEVILEEKFHEDSYAYRPQRSPIDAVTICRERCFVHEWLLEIDIKGFFDNLDHEIMMQMLKKYTDDQFILLYCKRFLTANMINAEGIQSAREKGTPQGGVVSPILANLYLHEAFDQWMAEKFPAIKFERYADDIVIHCKSEEQAYFMKNRIQGRLELYKLELHLEKTRIVYTGTKNDHDHRNHDLSRKFTFLGYDFKPRLWRGKLVFTPGIGSGALKMIRHKIKDEWRLKARISDSLEDIAVDVNPKIRGWINYYGHHRRSDLYGLGYIINNYLARFIKKKRKVCKTWDQAWKSLLRVKADKPFTFAHWHMISPSKRRAV
jgi:RNA-directed DNA polymerase